MTTAVLLATARATPDRAAAALPLPGEAGGSPLARLHEQLRGRADTVVVVTRAALAVPLAPGGSEPVRPPDDEGDLEALADLLERAPRGPVLLVSADVVVSAAALDVVLADPRGAVTVLVGPPGLSWPVAVPGPVVTEAASPRHALAGRATGSALGVLRVPAGRRDEVAATAREAAAQLRAAQLPTTGGPPAQDALALLLVALVRAGQRVRPVPLRGFAWGRCLDAPSAAQAATRLAEVDEERARLDAAVKPDDGFFGTFFVSPYSKHLARAAGRAGLTPNQVTVTSMLLGAVAAALYAGGTRTSLVLGSLVAHAAFTLDCVDGQLARWSGAFSALGAYLDAVFDRVKEYLLYAGLAVGAARGGDDVWLLAALALLLQTAHHALQFSWPGDDQAAVLPRQGPVGVARLGDAAGAAGPARVAVAVSSTLQGSPLSRWGRRVVQMPIGERFAVDHRRGGARRAAGRPHRARRRDLPGPRLLHVRAAAPVGGRVSAVRHYRDDGPLVELLARRVPAARAALPWTLPAALPLLALLVVPARSAPLALAAATAVAALAAARASRSPSDGRLDWLVTPLLRAAEYGALLRLAVLDGAATVPACYALLAALAYHHYDLVYRLRDRGEEPSAALRRAGLGWEGRLLAVALLAALELLRPALYVAAPVLLLAYVVEGVRGWQRSGRLAA